MALNIKYKNRIVTDAELSALAVVGNFGRTYQTSDTNKLYFVDKNGDMNLCGEGVEVVASLDGSTNTATTNDILSVPTFTDATITAGFGGSSTLVDGTRSAYGTDMLGTDNVGFMVQFSVTSLAMNKYRLDFDGAVNHWADWRVFASNTSYNTAVDVTTNATLLDTVTGNSLGIGQFTPYFTYTISGYYDYYYLVCDADSSGTHTRCSEVEFVADLR